MQPILLFEIRPQFCYQNIPSSSCFMVKQANTIMQLTLSMFDRLPISPILLLSHVTRTISDCRRIQGELQGVSQFVSSLKIIFNRTVNHSLTVISLPMFVLEWDPDSDISYNNIIINNNNNNNNNNRFTTKDSYTWNITHNTESTAVWSLKPERWRSPLVQEKYQEEKACYKRHPYSIIIIIIIIITNCNWVVTQWQWLFYMYTKYEIGCY